MERALIQAVFDNDLSKVQWLVTYHADVNALDIDDGGYIQGSPLFYACREGYRNIVEYLLLRGADPNFQDYAGYSAIQQIVYQMSEYSYLELQIYNYKDIIDLLLKYGANINSQNEIGNTPLNEAVNDDLYDMVVFLLDRGADPNIPNENGILPIDNTDDYRIKRLLK